MNISESPVPFVGGSGHRYAGHKHFLQHAMLSRRQLMRIAAGATGALLGSDLLLPGLALAHSSEPRPIPGGERFLGPGTELFHVFGIGPGVEESTITDFHGSIGAAQIQGKGRGMNTQTGDTSRLLFDVDMRFMQGTYIGMDGREHYGTFSFI